MNKKEKCGDCKFWLKNFKLGQDRRTRGPCEKNGQGVGMKVGPSSLACAQFKQA